MSLEANYFFVQVKTLKVAKVTSGPGLLKVNLLHTVELSNFILGASGSEGLNKVSIKKNIYIVKLDIII